MATECACAPTGRVSAPLTTAAMIAAVCGVALTAITSSAAPPIVTAPAIAAAAIAQTESPEAEPAGPSVLHAGSIWVKAKSDIEGSYRIERTDDGTFLVLGEGLEARTPPDPLRVVLSPLGVGDDLPRGITEATGRNALSGGLVLGNAASVKGDQGEQRFRIPEGTDLSRYRSLLLHCEEFSVLWGGTTLQEGELVSHGSDWTRKANRISGAYEILETGDGYLLRIGDDFRTRRGDDLAVVLSPFPVTVANDRNALTNALVVAPLRSARGGQEFKIPAGTDISTYRSLLVHSRGASRLWGGTNLNTSG